jgi:hypothetical protein
MASNSFDPSSPGAVGSQTKNHQRTSGSAPSTSRSKKTQLLTEFQPCDYSVVCGRGQNSFNHVGNCRFRSLASMFTERYSQADTRTAKSAIVSEIITMIRQAGGNFCKYKRGKWLEVGDHHAREKVGASLRDLLHTQYRSSTKAKAKAKGAKVGYRTPRKTGVKEKKKTNHLSDQKRADDTQHSDDSSTTSSCWGTSKDSLGFEYWLEDKFFDIEVF